MADSSHKIRQGKFGRGLAASLAGLRAGGAFALDGALSRLKNGGDAEPLDSVFARREAQRFVAELGRLKGTYVKIGQMLALLGEHFLPPVLTEALHELESGTEPLPWAVIGPIVEDALGPLMRELEVDKNALAAASLAQVHRATIIGTGESICLKIQYPGLARVIDDDFDTVVRMLYLARWIKAGREMDDWLASMREQLHREIDYRREAQVTAEIAGHVAEGAAELSAEGIHFHVPRIHPRYCADELLAMEYVDGLMVTTPEVSRLSQTRRNALGRAMLELFFLELYRWGQLQTDPNFGNYLLRLHKPGAPVAADELVLLDFGSVVECEEGFLIHLGNAIAAGQAQDRPLLVESLIGLGCLSPEASDEAATSFSDFCLALLEPLRPAAQLPPEFLNERGQYCWGRSQLMRRVGKQAANSAATRHFQAPSREFAMIARKLTGVFTFIAVLNAEFNANDIVQKYLERWFEED